MEPQDPDTEDDAVVEEEDAADSPESSCEGEETARLVQLAQGGDVDALNELFARHYQTMVELARRRLGARLRAKEEPDDLAQTTFREATRDFANYQYRGEGSFLRWLIQILQNKIRDRAEFYSAGKRDLSKERPMEAPALDRDSGVRSFEPSADDLTVTLQVQRGEDYDLVRKALAELSPDHRKAITLVFFQGLSLREAGRQLGGRTEDAVRMLLRRAEARMGEILRVTFGAEGPRLD